MKHNKIEDRSSKTGRRDGKATPGSLADLSETKPRQNQQTGFLSARNGSRWLPSRRCTQFYEEKKFPANLNMEVHITSKHIGIFLAQDTKVVKSLLGFVENSYDKNGQGHTVINILLKHTFGDN